MTEIIKQRSNPTRQDTATIREIAQVGNMDPVKLLACIKETFPQAVMQSPVAASGLRLAFDNYEKKRGKYQPGAPAPQQAQHRAPPVERPGQFQTEDNLMNDDIYDEFTTDKETESQWASSAGIRQEFHNDLEAFKEFRRAEARGLIRIQGGRHV